MDSGDEEEENQEEPEVIVAIISFILGCACQSPRFGQIPTASELILSFLSCRRKPNLPKAEEAPKLPNWV